MECLQYESISGILSISVGSFKPCYKWNAFNTMAAIPVVVGFQVCFKPCYKWNAFNTLDFNKNIDFMAS